MNRWRLSMWSSVLLLSSCIIADRDNPCDPSAPNPDPSACRGRCLAVECEPGSGAVFSAADGCQCVACEAIECADDEYQNGCGCAFLNGVLDCSGDACALTCLDGFADCDQVQSNGCEAVLATDLEHCGSCRRSCFDSTCEAGQCLPVRLVEDVENPHAGLAADDELVYYFNAAGILKMSAGGGAPVRVGTAGSATPAMTQDASHVFWADPQQGIHWASKSEAFEGHMETQNQVIPYGLAADDTHLYYVAGDYTGTNLHAAFRSVNRSNGRHLLVNDGVLKVALAVRGGFLYWLTSTGTLMRVPADGTGPATPVFDLADGASVVARLHIDDEHAYILRPSGLHRVQLGGGVHELLHPGVAPASGLHVDSTHVYWSAGRPAILRRIHKQTLELQTLEASMPGALAGNSRHLFVISGEINKFEIVRVSK